LHVQEFFTNPIITKRFLKGC